MLFRSWDQPTHLRKDKSALEEDIAITRRNITQTYTRGGGQWFYDFGPGDIGGWWDDSTLLRDIGTMKSIFDKYLQKPYKHDADALFVYDVDVFYHLAHNWIIDVISTTAVDWASADAYHSGVSFDECLLFDLDKMDLNKYKVVVFANTFKLTDNQREFIKTKVATNGRTIVWNYMPGYTNGNELNENFIKELVQIDIEKTYLTQKPPTVIIDVNKDENYTVLSRSQASMPWLSHEGQWIEKLPVYVIKDKDANVIAHIKEKNYIGSA